jgi:hypothetical protein
MMIALDNGQPLLRTDEHDSRRKDDRVQNTAAVLLQGNNDALVLLAIDCFSRIIDVLAKVGGEDGSSSYAFFTSFSSPR